jgi:hypothetical protein
LKINLKK